MKAVRFHKTGGPEVLVYEDVADPEESHTLGNIDPPRGPDRHRLQLPRTAVRSHA